MPVLITGFGPFPGVPDNVSGRLALTVASIGALSQGQHRLHAELLPTEWEAVARQAPLLLERLSPRLVVHFGVSMRAQGFCIERSAHNVAARRVDACGAFPARTDISDLGEARIDTGLPAARLAGHLRSHGLPARASRSAGAYLCNFLYYLSLDWAKRRNGLCDVCFVHVPPPARLDERELLRGAELILAYLLDRTQANRDVSARQALAKTGPAAARAG